MLLAMIPIAEEEDMPAPLAPAWRLHRRPSPHLDGQQRWDRAYLLLLQWTQPAPSAQLQLPPPTQPRLLADHEEDNHDGRSVCARLDPAPNPHAND
jgi:hypothetical protein